MPIAQDVLDFWFGQLSADDTAAPEVAARWYKKDLDFDHLIRERFLDLLLSILRGEQDAWLDAPSTRLGYVIVLDQFSRNIFRDTRLAFASDSVALSAALTGIEQGHDRALRGDMRAFMYLPLMHAEDLEVQTQCVACFARFRDESSGRLRAQLDNNYSFAVRHRDIVARFGRFPHRNRVLGRASTPEETTFLAEPGSSF